MTYLPWDRHIYWHTHRIRWNKCIIAWIQNESTTVVILRAGGASPAALHRWRSIGVASSGSDRRNRLITYLYAIMHYAQYRAGITTLVFLVWFRDNFVLAPVPGVSKKMVYSQQQRRLSHLCILQVINVPMHCDPATTGNSPTVNVITRLICIWNWAIIWGILVSEQNNETCKTIIFSFFHEIVRQWYDAPTKTLTRHTIYCHIWYLVSTKLFNYEYGIV